MNASKVKSEVPIEKLDDAVSLAFNEVTLRPAGIPLPV
jgi:hypothetical protein